MRNFIFELLSQIPYDGMNYLWLNGYKFMWNHMGNCWEQVQKFPDE